MAMGDTIHIPRVNLGSQGLEVSKLGYGCMGLTGIYNDAVPEDIAISLIKHAFSKGITFFDTSDVYAAHVNEVLVGKALKDLPRDQIQIATKFGIVKKEDSKIIVNGSPEYVRSCCEGSLQRLGVEYIDLYYQHRVDKTVPIEDTMGELKKLVEEGKIKYIGLSEANTDTIRRAHAVHPITALQMEWNLWTREIEPDIVPLCRELGIGLVPYCPLGGGFFGGKAIKESLPSCSFLAMLPRLQGENFDKNKIFYSRMEKLAEEKHRCTSSQLALAWLLHQGDDVVPIPGTTKIKNLESNIGSLQVKLNEDDLKEIEETLPISEVMGSRTTDALVQVSWRELGIGLVPYSPLGRGFFGGKAITESVPSYSFLAMQPRLQGENFDKNKIFYSRMEKLAEEKHGCTSSQLALAWLLHQGDDVVPIPGTTKIKNFESNIGSFKVKLNEDDLKKIEETVPISEVVGSQTTDAFVQCSWRFANTPPKA